MLIPHFVAGEHGLFGGHKSEDIRTFFSKKSTSYKSFFKLSDNVCDCVICFENFVKPLYHKKVVLE